MARDEKIVIRLRDDIKDRFQQAADGLGMTISALGSYVVADYLRRLDAEQRAQNHMIEVASTSMAELLRTQFEEVPEEKVNEAAQQFIKETSTKLVK